MLINSRCSCAGLCVVLEDFDFVIKRCSTQNWIKQYLEHCGHTIGICFLTVTRLIPNDEQTEEQTHPHSQLMIQIISWIHISFNPIYSLHYYNFETNVIFTFIAYPCL